MLNRKFRTLVFLGCFFLSLCSIVLAKENDMILRTQGLVNPGGNLKAGYLIINEMKVYINKNTQVMDYRGSPIPIEEIKPKKWVYMEVIKGEVIGTGRAKRIYLLPRYVEPREIDKFPFMK